MVEERKSGGFIFFILGTALFLAISPARPQKIEVRVEDGVTVIRNPVAPAPRPGGPSKVILTEDLVIGREATEANFLFAQLRSVGVDDEERIWALDWEDIKVHVFDKRGKLLKTFGKKGGGPEELQNPLHPSRR